MLVRRLDFGPDVREALALHVRALERQRLPGPRAVARRSRSRCASCTSATTWRRSAASSRRSTPSRPPATAATAPTTRRSPTCSSRTDAPGSTGSRETEPWDAVLALEPEPHRMLDGEDARRRAGGGGRLHRPEVAVHGRAQPPLRAARRGRRPGARAPRRTPSPTLRRAALVHDFGITGVPNSIWDKPGPLTRTEFDRVELHPMLTEQMLRRSPALAALNPVASAHHEKCDGSGYHTRVRADAGDSGGVRAGRDGGLRGADHRAGRPSAVPGRGRRRRAAAPRVSGGAGAPRDPRRARRRRPRRAERPRAQAAAEPGRAVPSRGRRAAPRGAGAHDARRSPTGSSSRPRPPITTSSTSTPRSGSRPAPPPRSGRCSTTSSNSALRRHGPYPNNLQTFDDTATVGEDAAARSPWAGGLARNGWADPASRPAHPGSPPGRMAPAGVAL